MDSGDTGEPSPGLVFADEVPTYPLLEDGWLAGTMAGLFERYGSAFAVQWRADPDRLLATALDLLSDLRMIVRVPGGILALPLLARYRNAVVQLRKRQAEPSLFD